MKAFVFGRHVDDPKGPKEEHGEVVIEAPSLAEARVAFAKEHGAKDPRAEVVRVNDASRGELVSGAKSRRSKKAKA